MVDLDFTTAYFEPPDMDAAHDEWGATCGAGAFAALTGRTLAECRPFFPLVTPRRTWVNPTQMHDALRSAGHLCHTSRRVPLLWSEAKLVLVQFVGPWMQPGVPASAAYRYTHWIALRSPGPECGYWCYDVNIGFWVSAEDWKRHMAPQLVSSTKRATGWTVFQSIDVHGARVSTAKGRT